MTDKDKENYKRELERVLKSANFKQSGDDWHRGDVNTRGAVSFNTESMLHQYGWPDSLSLLMSSIENLNLVNKDG